MMFFGFFFPVELFHSFSQPQIDYAAAQCGATAFLVREFGGTYLQGEVAFLCLVSGVIGIGLWSMRSWARAAMIFVSCVTVLFGIEETTEFFCTHGCREVDFTLPIMCIVFVLYFSRRKIKLAFEAPQTLNTVSER
jgi:hypothetical protein